MKYPELEFIKTNYIRSILDTQRNKGVIHVLLHVQGVCDIEVIKEKLFQYVLDRKDKMGQLCFPKLRTTFVDRWGIYAWNKNGGLVIYIQYYNLLFILFKYMCEKVNLKNCVKFMFRYLYIFKIISLSSV